MQARAHNFSLASMLAKSGSIGQGLRQVTNDDAILCSNSYMAGKRKQQRKQYQEMKARKGGQTAGFYGHGNCSQQRRVNYFRFTFLHFICARSPTPFSLCWLRYCCPSLPPQAGVKQDGVGT